MFNNWVLEKKKQQNQSQKAQKNARSQTLTWKIDSPDDKPAILSIHGLLEKLQDDVKSKGKHKQKE